MWKCKQVIDFDKSSTTVKEERSKTLLHQTKLSIIFSFGYINTMRISINARKNWHTIQQSEHTPGNVYVLLEGFWFCPNYEINFLFQGTKVHSYMFITKSYKGILYMKSWTTAFWIHQQTILLNVAKELHWWISCCSFGPYDAGKAFSSITFLEGGGASYSVTNSKYIFHF